MLQPILSITFWLIILIFPEVSYAQEAEWNLRRDKEGIRIYTRQVTDSDLDEFKAVVALEVPVQTLVKTLQDIDHMQDWAPNCKESRLLQLNNNEQYHYVISEAPFPIQDRDSYYYFHYEDVNEGVKIKMKALPDYQPEEEGMTRIPYLEGYWLFESMADNQTRVTYQVHADPGGSIPAWLANSVVVDSPFKTLNALREYLN